MATNKQEIEDNLIMIHQALSFMNEIDSASVIGASFVVTNNADYEEGLGDTKVLIKEPSEELIEITIRRKVGKDYVYSCLSELVLMEKQLRAELKRVAEQKNSLEVWLDGRK